MDNRKKILVVDDEQVNLEFFEIMLTKLGFLIDVATDGDEVVEKITKLYPDLILLDNIMPRMSGWEVTKALKSNPKYQDIPIIMLSALDDVKDKIAGFELGVDDYITKPFNFAEVLARIRAVLRNRELFAQIAVRESRLCLAEELNRSIKNNLAEFVKSIDELDAAISIVVENKNEEQRKALAKHLGIIAEKNQSVRKHVAALDAMIEKVTIEWDDLKKNEIGISALENKLRKFLQQE